MPGSTPAFAAAISEHPVTASATGEVAGSVLETIGAGPALAVCFVTPAHGGALEDIAGAVEAILEPQVTIGMVAQSVIGPGREVEQGPGISLWVAANGTMSGISLDAGAGSPAGISGWPSALSFDPSGLILLAEPSSFPAEEFLAWLETEHPDMPVVGGLASAAHTIGGNSLVLGSSVRRSGAVGVLIGPDVKMEPLVSQGCRPFGRPLVVTRAEGNVIYELAGKSAIERLVSQASQELSEDEVESMAHGGLQIGRVIDEHNEEFGQGDFLIRQVFGTDRRSGAVAVGDQMPVGVTVQFHLRDAAAADRDLARHLEGQSAEAALLFSCTGRGTHLFGSPDHDAGALADYLGPIPTGGCFAAGEIGPVGGRNFLHGFTASMALFRS